MLPDGPAALDALLDADFEVNAKLLANRLGLGHHGRNQVARGRVSAQVLKRGMRERADRVETEVAPKLEPDFRADVARDRCFQTRRPERTGNFPDARGVCTVKLAEAELVAFNDLDDTRRNDFAGRVDDTANDRFNGNVPGNNATRVNGLDGCAGKALGHAFG